MKPHGLTVEKPHHLPGDHHGAIACKNCGTVFSGNYCNHCGQSSHVHRVNWHYIWHEVPHSVWHVDKGILFTLRQLFTRPGHTIREFLDGKRVNHYRPLALILLLGAILTFILHSFDVHLAEMGQNTMGLEIKGNGSERANQFQHEANAFVEKYRNLFQIALLPVTSLFTWLFFRRKGLNYPEHLVTNTFLANISLILTIVGILVFKMAGGTPSAYSVMMSVTVLISLSFTITAYIQLFRGQLKPFFIGLRVALASLCSLLVAGLVGGIIGAVYAVLVLKGDTAREAAAQKQKSAVEAPLSTKK
jgi:hypothetical protein